jgi:hypothetical protein
MTRPSTCSRTLASSGTRSSLRTSLSLVVVPFSTRPPRPQWRVPDRITVPRFTRDVDELRTWSMDIRQILTDNAIRDRLEPGDNDFLARAMGPHPPRDDAYWAQFMEDGHVRDNPDVPLPAPAG